MRFCFTLLLLNAAFSNELFVFDGDEYTTVVCDYKKMYNDTYDMHKLSYSDFKSNYQNMNGVFEKTFEHISLNQPAYDSVYNLGFNEEAIDSLYFITVQNKCGVNDEKSKHKLSKKQLNAVNVFIKNSYCQHVCTNQGN